MKVSLPIVALLLCATLCRGHNDEKEYPNLTNESKQAIGMYGLIGGVSTVGIYAGFYWLCHDELPKLSKHPLAYAMAVLLGSSILSWYKYKNVPESEFAYAKKGVVELSYDELLSLVFQIQKDDLVVALKNYFFRTKFPLVVAFEQLNQKWLVLEVYRDALNSVKISHLTDLYIEVDNLLAVIDAFQKILQESILVLKADSQFVEECNAYAQMETANAAASAATAAWVHALHSPSQTTNIHIQRH